MALDHGPDRLACGVDLDSLVAQVTDDASPVNPAHQAGCPYCQTALRGLRQSWADVQALAREPVPIPPGLTARIMRRVRELARDAAHNVILAGARGRTQISHAVIAQVAGRGALAVPGVLFASARPTAGQPNDPGRVALAIRVVTTYGPALQAIAAAVRSTLHRRLPHLTGAEVADIDIAFIDVAIDAEEPDA